MMALYFAVALLAWFLCVTLLFVVGRRVHEEGFRSFWAVLPMGVFSVVYVVLFPVMVFVWHLFA
jgi:hypothetical protein